MAYGIIDELANLLPCKMIHINVMSIKKVTTLIKDALNKKTKIGWWPLTLGRDGLPSDQQGATDPSDQVGASAPFVGWVVVPLREAAAPHL